MCFKVVLLGDAGTGKSSLASRFVKNEFLPYSESTLGVSYSSKTFDIPLKKKYPTEEESKADHPNHDDWIFYCSRNIGLDVTNDVNRSSSPPTCRVSFKIWDTAGQERFSNLAAMYYRGASIGILVYDICNPTSFEALQRWVTEIRDDDSVSSATSPSTNTTTDTVPQPVLASSPARSKTGVKSGEMNDIILAIVGNKCDLNCDRRISKSVAENFARKVNAFYIETSARENIKVEELFLEMGRRALDKWSTATNGYTNNNNQDDTIRLDGKTGKKSSSTCCLVS